jgi:hypothetical protein
MEQKILYSEEMVRLRNVNVRGTVALVYTCALVLLHELGRADV